ncbi:putative transposase element L1Md-A101/L1Md-A102/L1Md-A2 [Labeo rohita]|uniref:Putative transposase element L1Md-A101/L1Md-A102/L1Md-A2 n=1 Tax=Labeo rohita TaxID=84645 RepID=A0A498MM25_LABRO|nr:putative transposase element L1Md-A101/L1Md-A102/L1Md-A2 [Labeo rohita]
MCGLMAEKLRKYKFDTSSAARLSAAPASSSTVTRSRTTPPPLDSPEKMDAADLKAEILRSLRTDISEVIKSELKNALADDFNYLKNEMQAVKAEIINNTTAIHSEIDQMKTTIKEVESGLSTWSDEVNSLQTVVTDLKAEVTALKGKCKDLEGRMKRCNIRILGVAETDGSSSTGSMARLRREALHLEKDVLVDRSHRSLVPRRSDGKPRAIVAKLHYYQDAVEVLKRARTRAPLRFNGESIAIFPDYTSNVAKARAAFTEVRKLLHNRQGVRFGILFPARLRISHDGKEKEFTDAEEAKRYVKKNIISTEKD